MLKTYVMMEMRIKSYVNNQKGEGMVGWVVAAALTVVIVALVHTALKGWINGTFIDSIKEKAQSILS